MAARTDLSWLELNNAFGSEIFITSNESTDPSTVSTFVYLDLSKLLREDVQSLTDTGVIKALIKLLEIARNAQEKLNEDKPAGERMAAFAAPTIGTPANGFVPVTRTIASRYELASAISIISTTA